MICFVKLKKLLPTIIHRTIKLQRKKTKIVSFIDEKIDDDDGDNDESVEQDSELKKSEYFIHGILMHMNVILTALWPCQFFECHMSSFIT